jgi:hypothetical protein
MNLAAAQAVTPAHTLDAIRKRLAYLCDVGALSEVKAAVMLARAAEAGQEAVRAMQPETP